MRPSLRQAQIRHRLSTPRSNDHHLAAERTRRRFLSVCIFGASLAPAFSGTPQAAPGADAEAVTIDTTFTVMTPPVRLDEPAHTAEASVVLMAGAMVC